MRVALICAVEEEIGKLRAHMERPAVRKEAGIPFIEGPLFGHPVLLGLAGVGKVNAGAATQHVVDTWQPDMLLNIGLAGNCTDTLPLGSAVVADRLVYHDFAYAADGPPWLSEFTPDADLQELARQACARQGLVYMSGTVATGDQFIDSSERRADIIARTGCACVEMEAAAIAHMAHKNGLRYAVIKIMSDNAGDGAHDTFAETLSLDAYCGVSVGVVLKILEALSR